MTAFLCTVPILLLAQQAEPTLPQVSEVAAAFDRRDAQYRNLRIEVAIETNARPDVGGTPLAPPDAPEIYQAVDTWLLASPDPDKNLSWRWRLERRTKGEAKPFLLVTWDGKESREFYRNDNAGKQNIASLTPFAADYGRIVHWLEDVMFGTPPRDKSWPYKSSADRLSQCGFKVVGRDQLFDEDVFVLEGLAYPVEFAKEQKVKPEDLCTTRMWVGAGPRFDLRQLESEYRGQTILSVKIPEIGQAGGVSYPKRGEVRTNITLVESGQVEQEIYKFEVKTFQVDANFQPEEFTFDWPSHTVVGDARTNTAMVIPPKPGDVLVDELKE